MAHNVYLQHCAASISRISGVRASGVAWRSEVPTAMRETVVREIRALTGIRGIAALYVAMYHFLLAEPIAAPPAIVATMFGHGYIAVDLFFVLSGFVMALSYKRMFEAPLTFKLLLVFLGRRLARIYPLYFGVSLVAIVTIALHYSHRVAPADLAVAIPANLAMVQSWGGWSNLEAPMWSISTEWAAYLLFPLFLIASFRSQRIAFVTLAACILTLVGLSLVPAFVDPTGYKGYPLDQLFRVPGALLARCFAEFVIGLLTFRFSKTVMGQRLAAGNWLSIALAGLIVTCLPWRASDLMLIASFALLIVTIAADRGAIAAILGSRMIYLLGVWSYAIYLIHPIVRKLVLPSAVKLAQHFIPNSFALPVGVLITLPFLVAASAISYRLIELPGRSAIKALIARKWLGRRATSFNNPFPEPKTVVNAKAE